MVFSRRSALGGTQNALSVALAERRARGERVLDLTESNPTRAGIPYATEAILAALARPEAMTYEPEPFGLPHAREAVARMYGVDASRVVLTASTSEAYGFLLKLLADPGDEVLAPEPSYPLLAHLAHLEDVRLVPYRLRYDGAWYTDLASARSRASIRTRAVLAVSPNNPTGNCLDADELAALLEVAPLICDEVFAPYMFRERPHRVRCAATEARAGLVFSLGGLSKLAALPQMKLAWIIAGGADERVREALARLELVADAYLSVATPVQHALPALLEVAASSRDAILSRTRRNLAALDKATRGTAVTRLDVEGGWYATLRAPRLQAEQDLVLSLLDRGVYVHPGAFFDFEEEGHLVVSLLTAEPAFDEGVGILMSWLSRS